MEHYEIATYGTLALADFLPERGVKKLLAQILQNEKDTDAGLTRIAEQTVNRLRRIGVGRATQNRCGGGGTLGVPPFRVRGDGTRGAGAFGGYPDGRAGAGQAVPGNRAASDAGPEGGSGRWFVVSF